MDIVDLKMILELQKNGRRSYVELGKTLGVVEGTIRKRFRKLTKRNIVKVVAVPNLAKLGFTCMNVMALQVRMADLTKVALILAQKPNVCHLAFVTGRYDLIAIIVTRTPHELSNFIQREISAMPGITRTETFVELELIKGAWMGLDTDQLLANLVLTLSDWGQERK